MIRFTESALKRIVTAFKDPKISSEYGLRIGLVGASCSGKYIFGLDKPTPNDERFGFEGFRVLVDKAHLMYVIGKTIDYVEAGESPGFVFL